MDRDIIINRIVKIVNESLDGVEIARGQEDVDLTALGLSSISFIRMVVTLEDEFECLIPDDKLYVEEMNTINKILDVVSAVTGI